MRYGRVMGVPYDVCMRMHRGLAVTGVSAAFADHSGRGGGESGKAAGRAERGAEAQHVAAGGIAADERRKVLP